MEPSTPDITTAMMTRQFDLADGGYVDIFIWKPDSPGDDYPTCKYLIRGLGDEKIRVGHGVDEVDTVMTTLQIIGIDLYDSQEYREGRLTWLGTRDLHLPLLPGEAEGKEGYEKGQLLTLAGEVSVLLVPGTKFPYIAWPGERLQRLVSRLTQVAEATMDAELKKELQGLIAGLSADQKYYEAVCKSEELDVSYVIAQETAYPEADG